MAIDATDLRPSKIYKRFFAIAIALFAACSFILQVITFNREVEITQSLYNGFKNTYPDQVKTFQWANGASSNYSIVQIVGFSLLIFFVVFLLIDIAYAAEMGEFKYKKLNSLKGKAAILADLAIIFIFIGVFYCYSVLNDPTALQRPLNWVWVAASALICGSSSHMLLLHDHLSNQRIKSVPRTQDDDYKQNFLKESYDIELAEYHDAIASLIAIGGSVGAALVISSILQYIFMLPTAISFSNEFGNLILLYFLKVLTLIFGLIIGLIYQLLFEMHAITTLVRKNAL